MTTTTQFGFNSGRRANRIWKNRLQKLEAHLTVMLEETHELYTDISQVTIDTYTAIQGSVQKRKRGLLVDMFGE